MLTSLYKVACSTRISSYYTLLLLAFAALGKLHEGSVFITTSGYGDKRCTKR